MAERGWFEKDKWTVDWNVDYMYRQILHNREVDIVDL